MDKITYLAQLADGLARWVPERERQDILRYYAEYFEEAGEEREAEVVAELGDPWALSSRLAVEGGYVSREGAAAWTPRKRRKWPWVLAGTLTAVVIIATVGIVALTRMWFGFGRAMSDVVISNAVDNAEMIPNEPVTEEWSADRFADYGFIVSGEDSGTAYIVNGAEYQGGFWTMEDGYLEPFNTVDADISLGNITVTAADDYALFIDQSEVLKGYSISWEVKDGKLKLKDGSNGKADINGFKDLQNLFGGSAVEISITVPEGAMMDKITAKTGMGNLFVSSVRAEKVELSTGMGNVECYEPREVKKLDLESGMGDVTLGMGELWDGLDIDLETGMGNVEANMGCFEDECEYELESGLGNVSINGDSRGSKVEQKGKYSCKLEAESGMGDVDVYFYDDRW